jgi:hypothetical protein
LHLEHKDGNWTAKRERTYRIVKSKRYLLKKKAKYAIAIIVSVAVAILVVYYAFGPKNTAAVDPTPRIAIVDHLSLQWPDQTFNQTMMEILQTTGLQVDYYPSKDVTVDFYRNLPQHNYKLIIFRVHSTAESSVEGTPPYVVFFTSENYTNLDHVAEQMDMRVVYVRFPDSEATYFGITPKFIAESMNGRLNNTIIIAMGCEGLKENTMAQAFIDKGAEAYISWNGSVSVDHTDDSTVSLLRHLITENRTVAEAVRLTMTEMGPDPVDKSILLFYPDRAGSSFLQVDLAIMSKTIRLVTSGVSMDKDDHYKKLSQLCAQTDSMRLGTIPQSPLNLLAAPGKVETKKKRVGSGAPFD